MGSCADAGTATPMRTRASTVQAVTGARRIGATVPSGPPRPGGVLMPDRLPSYDELPAVEGKPAHSSWGLWGDDDVFGCLNLLTPERAVRAAGLVRRGATFALNL